MASLYGIDLGTSNIKMLDKDKNQILDERNVIAIKSNKEVAAIGDEAYEMFEKAPENIQIIFPIQNGVIADIKSMQLLLNSFLKKLRDGNSRGADYVVAVPSDTTPVEKKAFYDLVKDAEVKARNIRVVDKSIADAVGLGLNVSEAKGKMIVNIGADTTEISILSFGGIVVSKLLKMGGNKFAETICSSVKKNHNFMIGKKTAERLIMETAYAANLELKTMPVYGRDLVSGLPKQMEISSEIISDALTEPIHIIVDAIKMILERTPPELGADIIRSGMYLTGGASQIKNLDILIEAETAVHVNCLENPSESVVRGLVSIIENPELKNFLYSDK